jgi:hypothetical protein
MNQRRALPIIGIAFAAQIARFSHSHLITPALTNAPTNSSGVTRLPALVPDRPPCRRIELLPLGLIAVFQHMLRETHFPKLLVVIYGEPPNAINPHSNVPSPRELTAHSLTLNEDHGHNKGGGMLSP